MDAQHLLLPDAQVRIGNRAEAGRGFLRNGDYPVGERLDGRVLCATVQAVVVGEDVGASVADKVVDILAIDTFVENVDVVAFALLDFGD